MAVVTVSSEDARLRWRETIDAAYADKNNVVIERYNRPIVVLMHYERYSRLLELERIAEAKRQFAEMDAGNYVRLEDLDKELAAIDARRVKP